MKKNFVTYFQKHVLQFTKQHKLLTSNEHSFIVAVSGGLDSMALLHTLYHYNHGELRPRLKVVTFDHGLRKRSLEDAQFVQSYCKSLSIPCDLHRLFLQATSNVEHTARELRRHIYTQYIMKGERVFVAHHIDDAFEWHLLQTLKTSTRCLGIPVFNNGICRPFLCVPRTLIERYVRSNNIPFKEDHTNLQLHYERNYIRHKVIPSIKQRYPQYLKSFVFRMQKEIEQQEMVRDHHHDSIRLIKSHIGGYIIQFKQSALNEKGLKEKIIYIIHQLSNRQRGMLMVEVDKLLQAVVRGKKGPMSFSGNVGCMMSSHSLYFYSKSARSPLMLGEFEQITNLDELWKYPFARMKGNLKKISLPRIKQGPLWLDISLDDLIFTPELFTRVCVQHTVQEQELIDCKFQLVRLT